jgi:hypothetical protein
MTVLKAGEILKELLAVDYRKAVTITKKEANTDLLSRRQLQRVSQSVNTAKSYLWNQPRLREDNTFISDQLLHTITLKLFRMPRFIFHGDVM